MDDRLLSRFFHHIILDLEQQERCRVVLPDNSAVVLSKHEVGGGIRNFIVFVTAVDPHLKLSNKDVLLRAIQGNDKLKHFHIDTVAWKSKRRPTSPDDLFWQHVVKIVYANKDNLESVSLNPCYHLLFPAIRDLSNLRVLELTFDNQFSVMDFAVNYVRGTWPRLEVLVVRLSGFHPLRPAIVDVIFGEAYPALKSLFLQGFTPDVNISRFLSSCHLLTRLSLLTPVDEFPFEPPYQFVLPSMSSLKELAITDRHITHYYTHVQTVVSTIILYDEQWPIEPFSDTHVNTVSHLSSSSVFPSLQTVVFRSILDSTVEKVFDLSYSTDE